MPALNLAICREGSTLLQFFINFVFEEKIWRETIRNLSAENLFNKDSQRLYARVLNQIYYLNLYIRNICSYVQKTSHIREVNNTTPNTSGQLGPSLLGSSTKKINPYFVTGFTDAECSSVYVKIYKNNKVKTGWAVGARFEICLHIKDRGLLEKIQGSLGGVGAISTRNNYVQYIVSSPKDLKVIIDHLDKDSLITQKRADYELFKQAFELISCKEHLTIEGLHKLVAIKATMNKGLSDQLKAAFPDIIPVLRPIVEFKGIPADQPNWLAGFTTGEGCLNINITKSSTNKSGNQVQLKFQITQHTRDAELLKSLVSYLSCGYYYASKGRDWGNFFVIRFSDIESKIIPFFDKYQILGVKSKDYADFKQVSVFCTKNA